MGTYWCNQKCFEIIMPIDKPLVFISYSSKDKPRAKQLAGALHTYGIEIWMDHEQIKIGDSIPTKISDGLACSNILLFLVSKNSGNSPWCRSEYEPILMEEINTRRKVVVPVRLDDSDVPVLLRPKLCCDLRGIIDPTSVRELAETILEQSNKTNRIKPSPSLKRFQIPKQVAEGLLLLLILDQYQDGVYGVWGRSLAETAGVFGHAENPGSITVSTWVADTLGACRTFTRHVLSLRPREPYGRV
jgi:TIR domain-containing protein